MQFKAAVLNKNPQASKYEDKIVKIQPLELLVSCRWRYDKDSVLECRYTPTCKRLALKLAILVTPYEWGESSNFNDHFHDHKSLKTTRIN